MSIRSLEYSNSGDCILIATGNAQARVVDRDGTEIFTCLKGDQYLFDLAKTHVRLTSDVPPITQLAYNSSGARGNDQQRNMAPQRP